MSTKPILQALVLADQVYTDQTTGKKIIAGTFNRLWAKQFPTQFSRRTYAYICLTEIVGTVELNLRYVDLQDESVLMEIKSTPIRSKDPLRTLELVVEVPTYPMPHPGTFAFELHAGDELLGSKRILVAEVSKRKQSDAD